MANWDELIRACQPRKIAAQLIDERPDLDWDTLRYTPQEALEGSNELHLVIGSRLEAYCGGGGYYDPDPPTIYLNPALGRRDNFTLLHELGHHLQQQHDRWACALLDIIDKTARTSLEEQVSDQIAQLALLPSSQGVIEPRSANPAALMAYAYRTNVASRSAVLHHVAHELGPNAKWILALADRDGRVQQARTTYDAYPPAVGSLQPTFAELFEQATNQPVRRHLTRAVTYSTGTILRDMDAVAHLDDTGDWAFIGLQPHHYFAPADYEQLRLECTRPSCGNSFKPVDATEVCPDCAEPKCPQCRARTCDCGWIEARQCSNCFMVWSPAELAKNHHECP